MMELNYIIEAASSNIKEGTLILHKSIKVHNKFKVYKEFCYDLYYVKQDEKTLLFSYKEMKIALADEIDKVWLYCDKLYMRKLIKWFTSDEYKSMLKDGI